MLFSNSYQREIRLVLHCPFCGAPEDERVSGVDEFGSNIVLLMFDCPFSLKTPTEIISQDDSVTQKFLDDWRQKNGEAWLESIGPILKNREVRNMERMAKRSSAA